MKRLVMFRRLTLAATVGAVFASLPVAAAGQSPSVYRVPVTGVVELGLAPFIERSIQEAAAAGASALILDMDTPGGRVDAAERISDALADARAAARSRRRLNICAAHALY